MTTLWFSISAQGIESQIANYTHSFAQSIKWPNKKDSYEIRVISQNKPLIAAFESLATSKRIDDKPIKVSFSSYVSIPDNVDILFVSNTYNGALQTIVDRLAGKPVLVITDQSPDQQYVMINFVRSSKDQLAFEFNRTNINNQNLELGPEFNLLGGDEINVARLYKQVRDSLRDMDLRSRAVEKRIDSLNLQAAVALRIANDRIRKVQEQEVEIERRQAELNRQNKVLDSLTIEFRNSETKLNTLTEVLDRREKELTILGEEIKLQESSIATGNKTLKKQGELIKQRNEEIAEREASLQRMVSIVDSQQDALYLLILFSFFLAVILVFAYRAYQARRRDAKKLNEQKEELSDLIEELQSTQTQLVHSEKMASLGTLTAGIAHEINNAINYVYSGIHVLDSKFSEIKPIIQDLKHIEDGDEDINQKVLRLIEQKRKVDYDSSEEVIGTMIKSIQIGAERTINIVKGLRTFSRAQEESMSEIDIHDDIEVALLLLKNKIQHSVIIEKELAENLPTMYGYPGQIGQAILNIISNAIDALDDKNDSKVIIKTSLKEEHVYISIKDNGIGIKKEDMDRIFDPFYTTKKIGEGTGLGLSITYGIVEKHNGSITVESERGKGTEFKIGLPLHPQSLK